jgi:hypothetical protein
MIEKLVKKMSGIDGIDVSESSAPAQNWIEDTNYKMIPDDYSEFLSKVNGVSGYFGYVRIYGVNPVKHTDVIGWNRIETWKFAWGKKVSGYFCFAGDAFGAQYAYEFNDGVFGTNIYMLDAYTMDVQIEFCSFEDFFETEFLRICAAPYDRVMLSAHRKFGRVDAKNHFIYSPSLHLGGQEDLENLVEMEAETAMILNGDVYTQLYSAEEGSVLKGVSQYVDGTGRDRIKLDFLP